MQSDAQAGSQCHSVTEMTLLGTYNNQPCLNHNLLVFSRIQCGLSFSLTTGLPRTKPGDANKRRSEVSNPGLPFRLTRLNHPPPRLIRLCSNLIEDWRAGRCLKNEKFLFDFSFCQSWKWILLKDHQLPRKWPKTFFSNGLSQTLV